MQWVLVNRLILNLRRTSRNKAVASFSDIIEFVQPTHELSSVLGDIGAPLRMDVERFTDEHSGQQIEHNFEEQIPSKRKSTKAE